LATGEWLMPAAIWAGKPTAQAAHCHHLDSQSGANVMASTDSGATWTLRGQVHVPERVFDEHSVVQRRDGSLWMLVRAAYGIGESVSTDAGRTWSEGRRSEIPQVNSRTFIRRLASGRLLLVTHRPPDRKTRSHMMAHLSDDDGRTWRGGLMLDQRADVSYPDGVQGADGTIYVIYDFSRYRAKEILMARFREDDVLAGKFQSPGSEPRILVNKATGVRSKEAKRP